MSSTFFAAQKETVLAAQAEAAKKWPLSCTLQNFEGAAGKGATGKAVTKRKREGDTNLIIISLTLDYIFYTNGCTTPPHPKTI